MKILSTLTRMWFLRSFKPFKFTNEFDKTLLYEDCKGLGFYVHISFCKKICKFCPYCKELYFEEKIDKYIDSVVKEIKLVWMSSSARAASGWACVRTRTASSP